jgi:hypothetical protein
MQIALWRSSFLRGIIPLGYKNKTLWLIGKLTCMSDEDFIALREGFPSWTEELLKDLEKQTAQSK